MTVTAAVIVGFLEDEGQLVWLAGASHESTAGIVVDGVGTSASATATDVAWTRHPEASAGFAGALLLAAEAPLAEAPAAGAPGAESSSPVAVCHNPRLAMALVVQRFFAHLAADREAEYADPEVAALAARNLAWVRNARIGHNVVIGPQAAIGCSGMGFERAPDGSLVRFPQLGSVIIEDDVDVAAHATVQRGSLGETLLRRGAKIGPHVNVGHNVDVGEHVLVAGHVQIGGSSRIGRGAIIWQGAVIANGVTIGEGATVGMSAALRKDVAAGEVWAGNPARRIR